MRSNAKRFMNLFFRLDPIDAQKTRSFLRHFMSSTDSDMLDLEVPEEKDDKIEEGKSRVKAKAFRHASLHKQYLMQFRLLFRLLPFYVVFFGWIIGYYFLATGIIGEIQAKQVQIQSSLEAQNRQNLLMTEIIEIILENSTTTIRNVPISQDYVENLNEVQKINDLVNQFRNSDQTLEPVHQQIFFGMPCDYFRESTNPIVLQAYQSCGAASKGTNSVSLTDLNAQIYTIGVQLYDLYQSSAKTQADLTRLFYYGALLLQDLLVVSKTMLAVLQEATAEIFEEKAAQVQSEAIGFIVISIIAAGIVTLFSWKFIVKKIIDYDAKDREILQLVPIKLILANRYLRQHVLQDAGGMLDSIKRFI